MKSSIIFVASILLLISFTSAKYVTGQVSTNVFNRKNFVYLNKMAYSRGTGTFELKAYFQKPIQGSDVPKSIKFSVGLFTDNRWNDALERETCKDKDNEALNRYSLEIPTNGESVELSSSASQYVRTYVWFFALFDCEKELTKYMTAGNKIKWEITMVNSDGSHFSEEENGILAPLVVCTLLLYVFFANNSMKLYQFYKSEYEMDYPTLILLIALACETLALSCEVLHSIVYSYDGEGLWLFNFGNQGWGIISQFIITCLLLLIAYGWGIKFVEFEDMDIFLPIGILLGVLHLMIVGLGRITDNEHYHFHDYESWAGIVIIILRLLMYAFFVYLFWETYNKSHGHEKDFYKQFGILSTLYFMALPVLVFIASVFVAQYWRHKVVMIGNIFIQVIVMIIFTSLFNNKKNKFYNILFNKKGLVMTNSKYN